MNGMTKGAVVAIVAAAMLLVPATALAGGTKLHADLSGAKESGLSLIHI